ncbi:hypothetical protein AHiyo1_12930 [Arthrobacter sp. Hiyo1]|uniref:Uncharacterized protein n=1 Tax=Arthrobacter bambusae TaxID=1338426 RepID=A0AAW8DIC2_9MICC|nr:hypothetical protein [Arthrobacter bambusae]MDQ0129262.1 hypothetical protein [Arthrobacter bambusae]MDQ0180392.1 hypothetical protein [Arthrobacter bambusae]MDQ0238340.1 hypothetical protein [Arthrobacter bambusae]GAP58266.1 hypothetical protein AHiyo1_12930 [Arthrobacter sp. Hiyo1]
MRVMPFSIGVVGTLFGRYLQEYLAAMDANSMERVWHGAHRKAQEKNWSLIFVWVILGLMSISVLIAAGTQMMR